MRVVTTLLASAGSAMVASAATAAILLPMNAFADDTDQSTDDYGQCSGPYSRTIGLEEAGPYLEAEGTVPADGPLDGYDIGYVPDIVDGSPYDTAWEEDGEDWPASVSRSWLPDEVELETWLDGDGEVEEQYAYGDGPLTVTVERSQDYTDADAYIEQYYEVTVEEYFEGEDVRELDAGEGYYTGLEAVWVPEPGVVVTVGFWPESGQEWEEEGWEEETFDEGDPDEVLRIVEGITPS
ncbi:hypothetical protein DFP74_4555 [Nocardiopsis sp. Huas11]|uniref:hypothetical protein n=1 Tax=Nocardiopsis sp. Huas11 TaxID=2183912 RepID=UPI000EB27634|nr:hypothetical protein [Nocardiopsis sp. Huas11]RKS08833.1 hypothetical protein DFP74_4555 [Nocardiopsis sp. Huas11]